MPSLSRSLLRSLPLCLLTAASLLSTALAETLFGHCVGVADGDTCALLLTLENGSKKTEKIRFHAIDAPEKRQAYGQAAKQFVSNLIYDKDIRVEMQSRDRYGRIIGKIYVGDTYVNLAVVRAGYAWWYRRYAPTETSFEQAETSARAARRGLWQDTAPIPPWEFRHSGKK